MLKYIIVKKMFIYLQSKTITIIQMNKYKQNLKLDGNKVFSYNTHVATIEGTQLIQLGYWSQTTQKHINYVANELGLGLIKIQ